MPSRVRTGLEVLVQDRARELSGARLGLVAHPASVGPDLRHAADLVRAAGTLDLVALFGPQHGIRGEKQDNMIESDSFVDRQTGLPVHSLYGRVRQPTPDMLSGLDALLLDLQDVGVRIYTFAWTMTLAMEACRDAGVRFVVLDRPNPIGGDRREGPLLRPEFVSFVGREALPLRHGLTLGEIARWANQRIGCQLDVIACEGWSRPQWQDEAGLPWVLPSPNLPTLDACAVFPGTVLLEGTNMSEGRGTTRPFELIGAPYLDPHDFAARLTAAELPGVAFRPCWFEPTFQKHAGVACGGVQIHVTDRRALRPVEVGVAVLRAAMDLAPGEFAWRQPPYEYELEKLPVDLLWGGDGLRTALAQGASAREVLTGAEPEVRAFEDAAQGVLLYA